MDFSEKLKLLRKQANLSQEQLAEKLHVSRQAITKWETGGGIPDIENIKALSSLFESSIDDLLSHNATINKVNDYMYESITEYDIDAIKKYDVTLGGAKSITMIGTENEKIIVRLVSNEISNIQSCLKVKIDDIKNRIDIDVNRLAEMTEAKAKECLDLFLYVPQKYVDAIELNANCRCLHMSSLFIDNFEFSGKVENVYLNKVKGHIELNCNLDMDIVCQTLEGRIDINQICATSKITIPEHVEFKAITKGIANHIYYTIHNEKADCFASGTAKHMIELNGLKSELIINK